MAATTKDHPWPIDYHNWIIGFAIGCTSDGPHSINRGSFCWRMYFKLERQVVLGRFQEQSAIHDVKIECFVKLFPQKRNLSVRAVSGWPTDRYVAQKYLRTVDLVTVCHDVARSDSQIPDHTLPVRWWQLLPELEINGRGERPQDTCLRCPQFPRWLQRIEPHHSQ